MKSRIRMTLDTLEGRETPSGNPSAPDPGASGVPAMSPSDNPIIIEPDYHIILPPGQP
jgi:hypothetical protein